MKNTTKAFLSLVILTSLCLSGCGNSLAEPGQNDTAVVESKEFKDIKAKADKGDVEAQCWLAVCYNNGLYGCKIDKPQAQELYQKVAKHTNENLAAVQHAKGVCYKNGYVVAKDSVEAAKWYRKAAEQGYAPSQNSLGLCYASGEGVPKDDQKAFEWYRKAADQGFAISQSNIGKWYASGRVVDKDDNKTVEWYRKAAEQGYANARYYLALCYVDGEGVQKNHTEAVKWIRLAADQGYSDAQYALACCYYHGDGVAQSFSEALYWNRLAAKQGHTGAQEAMLELVAYEETPREIEQLTEIATSGKHPELIAGMIKNLAYDHDDTNTFASGLLVHAAKGGHLEVVKELIKCGADVKGLMGDNMSLYRAVEGGHLAVVKELIKHGADVNARCSGGMYNSVFLMTIIYGDITMIKELVKLGANVNIEALQHAIHNNQIAVIKELVKSGANVNAKVNTSIALDKLPLLYLATSYKDVNLETVKCLLDLGAIPTPTSDTVRVRRIVGYNDSRVRIGETWVGGVDGPASVPVPAYEYRRTPVYETVEETINLLEIASSSKKKALLEAAIKKWKK